MSHETFREHLALRLYGEIAAGEAAALEEHLRGCADCRRLGGELERDLGPLAPAAAREEEPPAGWRERLDAAAAALPRGRLRSLPLWTSVAGFAAGVLLTWALRPVPPVAIPAPGPPVVAFERETPPPPANTSGQLARLETWLRR
jgi:anti-sigma factor RsiW